MGGGVTMIFTLVLLAGMMYFMTRSQKKQQQERQKLLSAMKPGDAIVTIGGLHGVISELNEKTVFIDCEGIILEFDRAAIRNVTPGTTVTTDTTATTVEPTETVISEDTTDTTDTTTENKD